MNRFLIWAYQPFVHFVLRFRWLTLIVAAAHHGRHGLSVPQSSAKNSCRRSTKATFFYMPTAVPGMSIAEATKVLQIQDRMLRQFPEVETVFGKAGQSETSDRPRAPLDV